MYPGSSPPPPCCEISIWPTHTISFSEFFQTSTWAHAYLYTTLGTSLYFKIKFLDVLLHTHLVVIFGYIAYGYQQDLLTQRMNGTNNVPRLKALQDGDLKIGEKRKYFCQPNLNCSPQRTRDVPIYQNFYCTNIFQLAVEPSNYNFIVSP
jgi:hypothetical protein